MSIKKFTLNQWDKEFVVVLPTAQKLKNQVLNNLKKPKTKPIFGYINIGAIYGVDWVLPEFMEKLTSYYGTTVFWQEFVGPNGSGVRIQIGRDAYLTA